MSATQDVVNDHHWKNMNMKPQRKRKPLRFTEYDSDEREWEQEFDRHEKRSRKFRRNDREFDYR